MGSLNVDTIVYFDKIILIAACILFVVKTCKSAELYVYHLGEKQNYFDCYAWPQLRNKAKHRE